MSCKEERAVTYTKPLLVFTPRAPALLPGEIDKLRNTVFVSVSMTAISSVLSMSPEPGGDQLALLTYSLLRAVSRVMPRNT
jgi:hypothetical protein